MSTRPTPAAFITALVAGALLLLPRPAEAQRRFDLGMQAGIAITTSDFGDAALGTGSGFEAAVSYRFLRHLAVYAGWDWHRWSTESGVATFAGTDVDVEETGYAFGLRFEHPLGAEGSPALVIRGGGTLNHTEIENQNGDVIGDSGHGLGYEIGAGVALPFGVRWRLIPGVRVRSLSRDLAMGSAVTPVRLTYVEPGIRFLWSF